MLSVLALKKDIQLKCCVFHLEDKAKKKLDREWGKGTNEKFLGSGNGRGGGREGDPKINKETTTGFRLRHTSSTPRNGTEGGGGGRALWSWLPSGHF